MARSEKVDSADHALVRFLGQSSTGKMRWRGRRPGLAAETVVQGLEEEADYKALELSVTSGFDAQTAVERELVLRLASLLWRLRRAAAIETRSLAEISGQLTDNPGLPQLNVLEPYWCWSRIAGSAPSALMRRDTPRRKATTGGRKSAYCSCESG